MEITYDETITEVYDDYTYDEEDFDDAEDFDEDNFLCKIKIGSIVFTKNIGWVKITRIYWDALSREFCFKGLGLLNNCKYNAIRVCDLNGEMVFDNTEELFLLKNTNMDKQILNSDNHLKTNIMLDSTFFSDEVEIILNDYEIETHDGKMYAVKKKPKNSLSGYTTSPNLSGNTVHVSKISRTQIDSEACEDEVEIVLNDYEIEVRDGKTFAVKKKPKYPKTFIEVLNFWHPDRQIEDDYQRYYKKDLIEKFQNLLYARDAFWKIAGEEMGLGKSWEPDWTKSDYKFCIINMKNKIVCDDSYYISKFLAFPTAEMRDAFYTNFKDLIEDCKEFL